MRKISARSFSPDKMLARAGGMTSIINLGVVAVVAFLGYKLYQKFFGTTPFGSAADAADKAGSANLTTRNASEAAGLTALKASLTSQGMTVNSQHIGYANLLNSYIDTNGNVDEAQIISVIKAMSPQTFQLTAIAYAQRELLKFRNGLMHIFTFAVWADLFTEKKIYGTLKYHLSIVLSSSELSSINAYYSIIP